MVSFQVLTCGANGSGISSMICLEHTLNNQVKVVNQILVNVGDGTQRFCSEHKIKLDKVSCIVFSSLSPANISGFQGIFLALSDLVRKYSPLILFSLQIKGILQGKRKAYIMWSTRTKTNCGSYDSSY